MCWCGGGRGGCAEPCCVLPRESRFAATQKWGVCNLSAGGLGLDEGDPAVSSQRGATKCVCCGGHGTAATFPRTIIAHGGRIRVRCFYIRSEREKEIPRNRSQVMGRRRLVANWCLAVPARPCLGAGTQEGQRQLCRPPCFLHLPPKRLISQAAGLGESYSGVHRRWIFKAD